MSIPSCILHRLLLLPLRRLFSLHDRNLFVWKRSRLTNLARYRISKNK